MILNENDLEFIFAFYDSAIAIVSEKEKSTLAEELIRHMIAHGMEINNFAQEVGEHDEYLDEAIELFLENAEETDDGYWLEDEDDWDE
jgi:hypothetical protein